jgi:menaquinone-dependent protoporphyrinogen oxidase
MMRVLVAYATRHGSTAGIAERIAQTLRDDGIDADAQPASRDLDPTGYDAYVIGSAAYLFRWLDPATDLVRRHATLLRSRPVWLFSSGPLGTDPLDDQGRDQRTVAVPRAIPDLVRSLGARDHRVFFGALEPDRRPIGLAERLMALMPAGKDAHPMGDFRDWADIEAWAHGIACDLQPAPVAVAAR